GPADREGGAVGDGTGRVVPYLLADPEAGGEPQDDEHGGQDEPWAAPCRRRRGAALLRGVRCRRGGRLGERLLDAGQPGLDIGGAAARALRRAAGQGPAEGGGQSGALREP